MIVPSSWTANSTSSPSLICSARLIWSRPATWPKKDGRRNRYHIQAHLPLPEPDGPERTIGEILALLVGSDTTAT
ncbi:MAG TPA: hypothetical protein VIY52_04205 [Streptosporangiaceae bacterium]